MTPRTEPTMGTTTPQGQPAATEGASPFATRGTNDAVDPAKELRNNPDLDVAQTPLSPEHGVRILNRLPVQLVGAAVAILMGFIIWNINSDDRGEQPAKPEIDENAQARERAQPTSDIATKMLGGQQGMILAPEPKPESKPEITLQPTGLTKVTEEPEPEPIETAPETSPEDVQLMQRIRQMKLSSFTAAVTSGSSVNNFREGAGSGTRTAGEMPLQTSGNAPTSPQTTAFASPAAGGTNVMDLYRQRMAQISAGGGATGAPAAGFGSGAAGLTGAGDDMSRPGSMHLTREQPDDAKWTLDSRVHTPTTPYEILTGTVIPAVLITGINSDLPGQMVAQVSQNVYDTTRGKHLIIPQGTRLIGQYGSSVTYGQERVLVAWNRIVFPDGKSIDIGSMPGATGAGYSGFKDQVNHHYWRLFGSAFLMSLISAGVVYSQDHYSNDDDEYGRISASSALAEQLANQIGQTAAQLIQRNLTIAPTIEIRPGFRFNVVVTKDMVFSKPYMSFDYRYRE